MHRILEQLIICSASCQFLSVLPYRTDIRNIIYSTNTDEITKACAVFYLVFSLLIAKDHKAYMVLPAENAVSFYGFRDEETTAVEALTEQDAENLIYDLSGRRIVDTEYLEHGVYIINGKKVVK